ncbi:CGGC domain-containing protein [Desulfocurvus sp. DL9XJH121]
MKDIAIIRCEKNEQRCPLTSCLKCAEAGTQGFAVHGEPCRVRGVFTCRGEDTDVALLAAVLKAKGAEAVHLPTCVFASKQDGAWTMGGGFCQRVDELVAAVRNEGLDCVLGTAHLPEGYAPALEN